MKILVLAKHVPDTETVIKLHDDNKTINRSSFKYMINPCCEYAIEEAVRTQEKFGGESVVVSVGPDYAKDALRKALAMGIDRAVWINTETEERLNNLDSYSISKAIHRVVEDEKPDLIFAGLNTTDGGSGNVGPMLAELSRMPSLINVSKIDWQDNGQSLTLEREVEGGIVEVYEVMLPCLIAPHQNLNVPRFPSLPNIMKAKRKEQKEILLSDSLDDISPKSFIQNYALPPSKPPAKILKDKALDEMIKEIVHLLRTEAKVI